MSADDYRNQESWRLRHPEDFRRRLGQRVGDLFTTQCNLSSNTAAYIGEVPVAEQHNGREKMNGR